MQKLKSLRERQKTYPFSARKEFQWNALISSPFFVNSSLFKMSKTDLSMLFCK